VGAPTFEMDYPCLSGQERRGNTHNRQYKPINQYRKIKINLV